MPEPTQQEIDARQQQAFAQRLAQLTPVTWGLYAVVAVNVGVWLANLASGVPYDKPGTADLFDWGGNSAWAVLRDGEYWRLLTATFLHAGFIHIGFNMVGLWESGRYLCRWLGNGQFLLVYFGAALAGSALSLHYSAQVAVSVGASGAVFGVLGAVIAVLLRHRGSIPGRMRTQLLTGQAVFVAYALFQGFAKQGVDNAAHVGGLLAGAAMAWLLVEKIDEGATRARRFRGQLQAGALAVAAVLALVFSAPAPAVDHRNLFKVQATVNRILPQIQAAEMALKRDAQAAKTGAMSDPQFVDAMEQRHIPAYQAISRVLEPLNLAGDDPFSQWLTDAKLFDVLVVETMQIEVGRARGRLTVAATDARLKQLDAELKKVTQRMNERAQKPVKPKE